MLDLTKNKMTKQKMILVGVHGRPSMKKVYSDMTEGNLIVRRRLRRRNVTYYRHYEDNVSDRLRRVNTPPNLSDNVVIRWGSREELPSNGGTVVYNRSSAIANATDKRESRNILATAGVVVPRMVTPDDSNISYPVVARPSVHSKGRNFIVIRDASQFRTHYQSHARRGWYYSEYVDKDSEFRFHVCHGKVLAIMEKPRPENRNLLAWNRALNEDPFVYVPWNALRERQGLANAAIESIKAVEALGLDFGGVDVMLVGDRAVVIEVNTAPTLNSSDYVAERYSKYFDWLFRSETRREHFTRLDYSDPRNFIFFNEQLEA